jgi:hypothetical protein
MEIFHAWKLLPPMKAVDLSWLKPWESPMHATARPPRWQTLLAFAIIYLVWGSTFLAIRIGVREVPPFLLAGMRFFAAGIVLYAWMRATGTASPSRREWASVTLLAALIFLVDY